VKYWAYFAAKLAVAMLFLWGLLKLILMLAPTPATFMYVQPRNPFAFDLGFTFLMLAYWLAAVGVIYVVIWDQRYRCRTCLRKLRMPVGRGSWKNVLLGAPSTEYICIYGHGTLDVPELQITGHQNPDWKPHDDDIWKELFPAEETKK